MKDLASFLLDSANGGVYAAPASATELQQVAVACGLAWFEIDLANVADKAAFLARCQLAFSLPPSFGYNWDALADCLEDLSWQPARGYVVICCNGGEFARRSSGDFAVALEVLAAAALYWLAQGKMFMVLVDTDTRRCRKLKRLPR